MKGNMEDLQSVSKEELGMIAFEIIAYSGDARSKLLEAVKQAKQKNMENCEKLIAEAKQCLTDAHRSQTQMIAAEARGENVEVGFITVHAQDHLMTTILLKDIVNNLLDIYK